ncbi:MAG: host attachment protein [Caulobacter sp.]|nr:host attachment protein [Caulobacter sp.]
MMIPTGALVAVVDGEKLAMFHNTGHETIVLAPAPLPKLEHAISGSGGHQSSSANPDNDTQAEDGFAGGVAAMLNRQALAGQFEALVVIAAPKTLGELRKHWHKALQAKLVGEIAKDLTGQTPAHIAAAITHA